MEINLKQPLLSFHLWICLLALVFFPCLAESQTTAPGEWTWVGGVSTPLVTCTRGNQCDGYPDPPTGYSGVYGTQGVPAAGNVPGSRSGASSWTDSSGNFWLFGGAGFDSGTIDGNLGDLWEFNPSTNEWTWVSGYNSIADACLPITGGSYCAQLGLFGTLGTPAPLNVPGGRNGGSSWTDSNGNAWIFAGYATGLYELWPNMNDVWRYAPSTNEWTWMGGTNCPISLIGIAICATQPGTYGTLGTPSAGNLPGSRANAPTWIDSNGKLWLYGGFGFDANAKDFPSGLNDLWEFDPESNEWTWIGGNSALPDAHSDSWPPVYGALGTPAAANNPGGRTGTSTWADGNGNLWLFGGQGSANDLWKYNTATNQWTWMSGNNTAQGFGCYTVMGIEECEAYGQLGVYGALGVPVAGNVPGSRGSAVTWVDSSGHLWLFGGTGLDAYGLQGIGYLGILNDLWEFDPATTQWTWMGGSNNAAESGGTYGVLGTPAAANVPPGRFGASSWTDSHGNFWLFGGSALMQPNSGWVNDLWVYEPPPSVPTPAFSPASGTYVGTQTISITDTTAGAAIYYTRDGSAPSTSSTLYSGAITVASTETLQAVALAKGALSSAVASAEYTISLPPDFSIAASPGSIAVTAEGSGTATISVSPQGGFASAVTFSCTSGLPAGASCSFSPPSVTLPGMASTTVTVTTSATKASLHRKSSPMLPDTTLAIALCCVGWKKRRRFQFLLLLTVSVAGLGLLSGCGGGSSTPAPVNSTVTVTATSGSLSHSTTISVAVN
jgi:N-acetylneuraminic acid mutarotase